MASHVQYLPVGVKGMGGWSNPAKVASLLMGGIRERAMEKWRHSSAPPSDVQGECIERYRSRRRHFNISLDETSELGSIIQVACPIAFSIYLCALLQQWYFTVQLRYSPCQLVYNSRLFLLYFSNDI